MWFLVELVNHIHISLRLHFTLIGSRDFLDVE